MLSLLAQRQRRRGTQSFTSTLLHLGAAGLFSRAAWAFFPPADAGGADLLSIFVSAVDAPAAAGPSFSFWTMLFFFATGLIGLTALIGLLKVGRLASEFSPVGGNSNLT